MIYLDTSCLLKLLVREPESDAVRELVAREDTVIVSSLVELEAEIQLKGGYLGGQWRASQWREYLARLTVLRQLNRSVSSRSAAEFSKRPSVSIAGPPKFIAAPWIDFTSQPWKSWGSIDS